MNRSFRPWLRSLSALSINFSAVYFGFVFVIPNFLQVNGTEKIHTLTKDITYGIVYLIISVGFERLLENDK